MKETNNSMLSQGRTSGRVRLPSALLYGGGSSLLRPGGSLVSWSNILEGRSIMLDHFYWGIGDGNSASFWEKVGAGMNL